MCVGWGASLGEWEHNNKFDKVLDGRTAPRTAAMDTFR